MHTRYCTIVATLFIGTSLGLIAGCIDDPRSLIYTGPGSEVDASPSLDTIDQSNDTLDEDGTSVPDAIQPDTDTTAPALPPPSCAHLAQNSPPPSSGEYLIRPPGSAEDVTVYCDFDTDGGAGYTYHSIDSETLAQDPDAYAAACAAVGMEPIVPRTKAHMQAILSWNEGMPPAIVNVFAEDTQTPGLGPWQGRCAGAPCTFYLADRKSSRCQTLTGTFTVQDPGRWENVELPPSCLHYREHSGASEDGIYLIAPEGQGSVEPLPVYCDMTTDGGGWTLALVSSDDGTTTWTWAARDLWTTRQDTIGSIDALNRDYKSAILHSLPFVDVLFRHAPSTVWASYHDVGSGTEAMSEFIASIEAPNCELNSGYPLSAGSLAMRSSIGSLCSTDLFFNIGDYSGQGASHCADMNRSANDVAYGPAWSGRNNSGCPFDDPGRYFGLGPDFNSAGTERNGLGFGWALNLNTGSSGQAQNYLQMFLREAPVSRPAATQSPAGPLVLTEAPSQTGSQCPSGSYDNAPTIAHPGRVICSTNDAGPPVLESCLAYRDRDSVNNTASGGISGIYSILPPRNPALEPFHVYCDMTTEGGGWTQIANVTRGVVAPFPGREFTGADPHTLGHSIDATGISFGEVALTHHGLPDHDFASFLLKESHLWNSQGPRNVYVQNNDRFTMFALQPGDTLVPGACFNSSTINCSQTQRTEGFGLVSVSSGQCAHLNGAIDVNAVCGAWGKAPYVGNTTWGLSGGRLLIR